MANNPKENDERIKRFRRAWAQFAPDKTFAGKTLAEFEAATEPSVATRTRIGELESELEAEQLNRDKADKVSMPLCTQVANSVKGDVTEGPNSDLWKAMGFVPDDEKKSGLTRKKVETTK